MHKAVFSKIVYKPAMYKEHVMVLEPALLLVLKMENGEKRIFNIFNEFCEVWQKKYTFSSNHTILRLNQIFKNKTFKLRWDLSLNEKDFDKVLSDTILFEY